MTTDVSRRIADRAAALGAELVRDPAAARFLADGRSGRFIASFLGRDCSVAHAARRWGMAPSLMNYWVRKMEALGLVRRVTPTAAESKPAAAVFSTAAPAYCVPRHVVGEALWRDLLTLHTRHVWGAVIDSTVHSSRGAAEASLWVYNDPRSDSFWRVFGTDPAMDAHDGSFVNYGTLLVTADSWRAMQGDLNRVVQKYMALSRRQRDEGQECCKVFYVTAANRMAQ